MSEGLSPRDATTVAVQLGRAPRGAVAVAHRCECGNPDVVRTRPRLDDGTPFPTSYYLTCPKLASAIGTLEASGLMAQMTARLEEDPQLQAAYQAAHADYLKRRAELGTVGQLADISAGGMPNRVKCLHALVAHSLAVGPGINLFGDEALELLAPWWRNGACVAGVA